MDNILDLDKQCPWILLLLVMQHLQECVRNQSEEEDADLLPEIMENEKKLGICQENAGEYERIRAI